MEARDLGIIRTYLGVRHTSCPPRAKIFARDNVCRVARARLLGLSGRQVLDGCIDWFSFFALVSGRGMRDREKEVDSSTMNLIKFFSFFEKAEIERNEFFRLNII